MKNNPLTLEELYKMDGRPVFCQFGDGTEGWAIVDVEIYTDKEIPPYISLYSYEMQFTQHMEPDTDLLNLEYEQDPDGHFGLHLLGWRAYRYSPYETTKNIGYGGEFCCNRCGYSFTDEEGNFNFCPSCGMPIIDMEV